MIKEHTYCDVCGKDMTSFDAEGDTVITGYSIEPNRVMLSHNKRTEYGSSSRAGFIPQGHFCSDDCLMLKLNLTLKEAGTELVCKPAMEKELIGKLEVRTGEDILTTFQKLPEGVHNLFIEGLNKILQENGENHD